MISRARPLTPFEQHLADYALAKPRVSRITPASLALVEADAELKAWQAFATRVRQLADAAERLGESHD